MPDSFDHDFYVSAPLITLKPTAQNTGIYGDIFSNKPFLSINQQEPEVLSKKRTLVFADILFEERKEKEKAAIIAYLKNAKAAGFNILIFTENSVENWDGVADLKNPPAYFLKQIYQLISEKSAERFRADELLILDYFRLNDLINLIKEIPWQDLVNKTEKLGILLEKMHCYHLSFNSEVETNTFLTAMASQANLLATKVQSVSFDLTGENSNNFPNMLSFLNQYIHLEQLHIDFPEINSVEHEAFHGLKAGLSQLKKLEVRNEKRINIKPLIEGSSNITDITVSDDTFQKIMDKLDFNKIKNIKLIGDHNRNKPVKFVAFPVICSNLLAIELNFIQLGANELIKCLQSAPHIEDLILNNCTITDSDSIPLSAVDLSRLKRLIIDNKLHEIVMPSQFLNILLSGAAHLEKLVLHTIDLSKNTIGEFKRDFTELITIDFSETTFLTSDFLSFLSKVPKLEKLDISEITFSGEYSKSSSTIQLPSLTELQWNVMLSQVLFSTIVRASKNLKIVRLCYVDGLRDGDSNNILDLSRLQGIQEIELRNSEIYEDTLEDFYVRNKNTLRTVDLTNSNISYADIKKYRDEYPKINTYCNDEELDEEELEEEESEEEQQDENEEQDEAEVLADHASLRFLDGSEQGETPQYYSYFPGVNPDTYRKHPWKPILDSLKMDRSLLANDEFSPTSLYDASTKDSNYYYRSGKMRPIKPSHGTHIILPSLSFHEKLYRLVIVNETGQAVDNALIEYAKKARFYRVVLKEPGNYTIHLSVMYPKKEPTHIMLEELKKKYQAWQGYNSRPLPKDGYTSWRESIAVWSKDKAGPCRLRAAALFSDLTSLGVNDVWLVDNDIHTFVEAVLDNIYYKIDPGGPTMECKEMPIKSLSSSYQDNKEEEVEEVGSIALDTSKNEVEEQDVDQNGELVDTENSLSKYTHARSAELIAIAPEAVFNQVKPTLLLTDSAADLIAFLKKNSALLHNALFETMPEALSLQGYHNDENGNIIEGTLFARNILDHSSSSSSSSSSSASTSKTLFIDISDWKSTAPLNDILDGNLENHQLSSDMKIIIIDDPKRAYYSEDICRRVPTKTTLSIGNELLAKAPPTILLGEETGETLVIDLYHSLFWERYLMGRRVPAAEEAGVFSFPWKIGELLHKLMQDKNIIKSIVFKNPPMNDPNFIHFMSVLQGLHRIPWANKVFRISPKLEFFETEGYDWKLLALSASLHDLRTANMSQLLVLSDMNILYFIGELRYSFNKNNQVILLPSHFHDASQKDKSLNLVLTPGLSEGALAELLAVAKAQKIALRFFVPNPKKLPANSPLHHLKLKAVEVVLNGKDEQELALNENALPANVTWQLHEDSYGAARNLMEKHKNAYYVHVSSLLPNELERFTSTLDEKQRMEMFKTGKIALNGILADLAVKLMQPNSIVILEGKIPPTLYEIITKLSLGQIDGQIYPGQLYILPSANQQTLAESITGTSLTVAPQATALSYASTDSYQKQKTLNAACKPLWVTADERNNFYSRTAEERANEFDMKRHLDIVKAFELSPFVMIPGKTGIGKSHFLETVLPTSQKTTNQLDEWLNTDKPCILIVDEASFSTELSGKGEHFLERFKSLLHKPPSFYWQGKIHPLSESHRVVFAFNPESYGAGRDTTGFLTEHKVAVTFDILPDYYLHARLIEPLCKQFGIEDSKIASLAAPILSIYKALTQKYPDDSLITPREIKLMITSIASYAKRHCIRSTRSLEILATEIAYDVGRQAIIDRPEVLTWFDRIDFRPTQNIIARQTLPKQLHVKDSNDMKARAKTHGQVMNLLYTMNMIAGLPKKNAVSINDIGLGGIILEGDSSIGKTKFINNIVANWQEKTSQAIYRISPSTPYFEKVKMLKIAFDEGAILIVDEINTTLMPPELLHYLMGKDEKGNPAKTKGFFLIATQNPSSFPGRLEEDPAFRHRTFKIKLNWKRFETPEKKEKLSSSAIIAEEDDDEEGDEFNEFNKALWSEVEKEAKELTSKSDDEIEEDNHEVTESAGATESAAEAEPAEAIESAPATESEEASESSETENDNQNKKRKCGYDNGLFANIPTDSSDNEIEEETNNSSGDSYYHFFSPSSSTQSSSSSSSSASSTAHGAKRKI